MKLFRIVTGLLVVCLGLVSTSLQAQSTGTIRGVVTDAESGETLPGANVQVTSPGVRTGAAANSSGEFAVGRLAAGTYTIRVSYIGYATHTVEAFAIAAGETKTLDFSLTLTGIQFNAIAITASRRPEKTLDAPASITVVDAREIETDIAPSTISLLRNVTGIDMAQTGIDRREVVLRGFNNAFSRSTYILTDYRQAGVASLGVNLHSIMPNMSVDLERVEIVRGPGSALYGPGVDSGVIHYLSKDPFSYPGTTVSISGGERSTIAGQFRHAGRNASENFGYKITGQFVQADDWELDPNDPDDQIQLSSDLRSRDYDYEKVNLNAMLQYRSEDNTTLTVNGGFSQLKANLLSGIGPLQADGFGYTYGQIRLQSGNFFAQAYLNRNDVGDSFVYNQSADIVDKSTLLNLQTQYDLRISEKHQAIVGIDYERTTPVTEETINGRNEDDDLISEFGAYVQTSSSLGEKLDVTLALRGDYNNLSENLQLSPRVALVLKPSPLHSFRATYNRAFSSPSTTDNFLDIVAREASPEGLPFDVRARGSFNGFTFARNEQYGALVNTDLVAYSLNPATLGAPTPAGLPLGVIYAGVHAGLAAIPPATLKTLLPAPLNGLPDPVIAGLVDLLSPSVTTVSGFSAGVLGLVKDPTKPDEITFIQDVVDIQPLRENITQTLEAGYKGLLMEKWFVAADVYYTKKKHFVGPLLVETPFVVVSQAQVAADLQAALEAGLLANDELSVTIQSFGFPAAAIPGLLASVAETIVNLSEAGLPDGPIAIVSPTENAPTLGTAPDLMLAYRNFGNLDFVGFDATIQTIWTDRFTTFANISVLSDNFFDNEELNETNTDLSLAINSPTFKFKTGFNYNVPSGVSFNASFRHVNGFPVASGPYIGDIENYQLLDVGVGYDLNKQAPGMRIDFSIQNLLDNEHREFVGAPKLGRFAMARITYKR